MIDDRQRGRGAIHPYVCISVPFELILYDGISATQVKEELANISEGLDLLVVEEGFPYISGETDKTTYETVFNARLNYDSGQGWYERKLAEVPTGLEDKVKCVQVAGQYHAQ